MDASDASVEIDPVLGLNPVVSFDGGKVKVAVLCKIAGTTEITSK